MEQRASLRATISSQIRIATLNRSLWSIGMLRSAVGAYWSVRTNQHGRAPSPLAVAWYVTHACPEQCDFCNVSRALEVEYPHLELSKACDVVDRVINSTQVFALGGGEPMAYPHIVPLIKHIKSRNGRVFIVTSGTTLSRSKAKELCAADPEMLMFSMLGDEKTHDMRMGRAGAFQRLISSIQTVLEFRVNSRVILNCAIGPLDTDSIPQVINISKNLGVDALRFSWLSFMTDSENSVEPVAEPYHIVEPGTVNSSEWLNGFQRLSKLRKHIGKAENGFVQFLPHLSDSELRNWFLGAGVSRTCLSLWHTLFLRPDGTIVPCGHMQSTHLGNIQSQSLESIWNGETLSSLRLSQRQNPFQMCGRCCKI